MMECNFALSIIIMNFDNDNFCAKSAYVHCKLQFSRPILLK